METLPLDTTIDCEAVVAVDIKVVDNIITISIIKHIKDFNFCQTLIVIFIYCPLLVVIVVIIIVVVVVVTIDLIWFGCVF